MEFAARLEEMTVETVTLDPELPEGFFRLPAPEADD